MRPTAEPGFHERAGLGRESSTERSRGKEIGFIKAPSRLYKSCQESADLVHRASRFTRPDRGGRATLLDSAMFRKLKSSFGGASKQRVKLRYDINVVSLEGLEGVESARIVWARQAKVQVTQLALVRNGTSGGG